MVELCRMPPDEDACYEWLERIRWRGEPVCPHCGGSRTSSSIPRERHYRCRDCRKALHGDHQDVHARDQAPVTGLDIRHLHGDDGAQGGRERKRSAGAGRPGTARRESGIAKRSKLQMTVGACPSLPPCFTRSRESAAVSGRPWRESGSDGALNEARPPWRRARPGKFSW